MISKSSLQFLEKRSKQTDKTQSKEAANIPKEKVQNEKRGRRSKGNNTESSPVHMKNTMFKLPVNRKQKTF